MLVQAPAAPSPVALARVGTDPAHRRLRDDLLPERLGEQPLDIADGKSAQEAEHDERLERVGASDALAHDRTCEAKLRRIPQPRPLQPHRATRRPHRPRFVAVAVADELLATLVAGTAKEQLNLALQRLLKDQLGAEPCDRLDRIDVALNASQRLLQLGPEALARDYARHQGVPPRSNSQDRVEATPSSLLPGLRDATVPALPVQSR